MANAAQFAAKCQRVATTVPRAQRAAGEQTARAIKPVWYAQAGLGPGSMVAKRKVSIGDSTVGTAEVTTLIRWQGPVHLVEGPTVQHFIGAKLLGTRNSLRAKSRLVGLNAAFGGSNRGAFGKLKKTANYNRYNSVRQQARKGELRQRGGKQALKTPDGLRAYAFHPGTRGRRFWARNKDSARTVASTVYRASALPSILREAGFR